MLSAVFGGMLIGLAAGLFWALNGRVAGISGIISGALTPRKGDAWWRWAFAGGLFAGGVILTFIRPLAFPADAGRVTLMDAAVAGLLVGFGTVMGGGCTSGHGVCGVSRLSRRSLVATVVFILAGMLSVGVFKILKGGVP